MNFKFIIILILIAIPTSVYFYRERNMLTSQPIVSREEITITIVPGWNLRQVATYLELKGFVSSSVDLYKVTGKPATVYTNCPVVSTTAERYKLCYGDKESVKIVSNDFAGRPDNVSMEGYLAPETYRAYKDATAQEIIVKLLYQRNNEFNYQEIQKIEKETSHSWHQILTLASLVEKEARTSEEMAMVADIFWRRYEQNWALQSCASVNYITGKNVPAVSAEDQQIDSPYNTYKYPGLPPGPICNPGKAAIKAALYPKKNNYWYFMTGTEGKMRYASTLDEHNTNIYKYLR